MPDPTPAAPAATPAPAAAPSTPPSGGTPPAAAAPSPDAKGGAPDSTVLGGGEPSADPKSSQNGEPGGSKAAPAEIEVKLPDGINVDAALMGEFKELAKASGMTSEQAQKFVDLQLKTNEAYAQAAENAWKQTRAKWSEEFKGDKEFGGQNFDASVKTARAAVAKFGSDTFRAFLNEFGVGDHPELIRFMVRVGKALGEDKVSAPTNAGSSNSKPSPDELLRVRYPSMFDK